MTFKYETTVTISQTEIDTEITFDAAYVDNGIGRYEFGSIVDVHHDWQWEFNGIEEIKFLESILKAVSRSILPREFRARKAYRKAFKNECRLVAKGFSLSLLNSPSFEEKLLVFASEQDFSE